MLVKAAPGIRVPMEGRATTYITGTDPVQVPDTAYYRRMVNEGVTDQSHRVVEIYDDAGRTLVSRVQEEYREDPNAVIFRLGFTVEEVEKLLS